MSVVTQTFDFGEYDFGTVPFGQSLGFGNQGMQMTAVIDDSSAVGKQLQGQIDTNNSIAKQFLGLNSDASSVGMQLRYVIDSLEQVGMQVLKVNKVTTATGMQLTSNPVDQGSPSNFQLQFKVETQGAFGKQVDVVISDQPNSSGMQLNSIVETTQALATEMNADPLAHRQHGVFGTSAFGTTPFGSEAYCGQLGAQIEFKVNTETGSNQQIRFQLDTESVRGQQIQFVIDAQAPVGMQFNAQSIAAVGMQFLSTFYNTTNLRILCEFPSRGLSTTGGTNAWGNDIGAGENWQSNSVATGDFSPFNLNTDVVEQVYRSATGVVTNVTLDCDTERAQGVGLDTLAILNHNLTRNATIQLIGSNNSNFSTTDVLINLQVVEDDLYFVNPTLPTQDETVRYWRFNISDSGNPDNFLSIGTLIFGSAAIFQGECFVDNLDYQLQDFADTVATEGFTNVSNSRTIKKKLGLDFRLLKLQNNNFDILRDIFKNQRTVLKCVYIPTPSKDDSEISSRFAVFGKLSTIPVEKHNNRGINQDFVDLSIDVDESL